MEGPWCRVSDIERTFLTNKMQVSGRIKTEHVAAFRQSRLDRDRGYTPIKIRNNRIGTNGFLNQRCALTPDLESILRARTGKIARIRKHNRGQSGHPSVCACCERPRLPLVVSKAACDLSVYPGCANASRTIVVFLRHTRIGVVEHGAGEMGSIPSVRC